MNKYIKSLNNLNHPHPVEDKNKKSKKNIVTNQSDNNEKNEDDYKFINKQYAKAKNFENFLDKINLIKDETE